MIGDQSDLPENVRPMQGRRAAAIRVTHKTPGTRTGTRRRYHYLRRHTPHYYIVLSGITLAMLVCALNLGAFLSKSIPLSEVAFGVVAVTTLVISTAFFWGFFMAMSANIPTRRVRVLIPHGAVGVLSPVFYTLNVSLDLEDLGLRPISGLSLVCGFLCLGLLGVQFTMGKGVVRSEPLHIVRPEP